MNNILVTHHTENIGLISGLTPLLIRTALISTLQAHFDSEVEISAGGTIPIIPPIKDFQFGTIIFVPVYVKIDGDWNTETIKLQLMPLFNAI